MRFETFREGRPITRYCPRCASETEHRPSGWLTFGAPWANLECSGCHTKYYRCRVHRDRFGAADVDTHEQAQGCHCVDAMEGNGLAMAS